MDRRISGVETGRGGRMSQEEFPHMTGGFACSCIDIELSE